jgi:hypothetical protein
MPNKTIIIGISGKKRAGKDTLANYLEQWCHTQYLYISGSDCKIYSFAYPLKSFCINVMGLSHENCYGTEEQKNSLTKYKWDNLPDKIRYAYSKDIGNAFPGPRYGYMTAREILQIVGTNVFRDMFDRNIWACGAINTIKNENKKIAIICDTRFTSEVNAVMAEKNGYIIRLLRQVAEDIHQSETELDNFNFNQFGDRALIIDNRQMTIDQQNQEGLKFFKMILNKHNIL